ncbi:MAG: hypothetical protein IKR57_00845 [Bacilli bacterium]|nr:hypothetical protein [Bacilli bacterium]
MKKKLIIIIVIILLILFVPIRTKYKDGGTVEYKALTYRIFKWNILNEDGSYYVSKDIYFFPNNFHKYEYYVPIITPNVSISYNDEVVDAMVYSYHWSKIYGEEVRYEIGDGSLEELELKESLAVDSGATLTFNTEYGIEDVEYSLYNESGSETVYNGLYYDQITQTLSLPNLEHGEYIIKFKLYNDEEDEDYALYAFKITTSNPDEEE